MFTSRFKAILAVSGLLGAAVAFQQLGSTARGSRDSTEARPAPRKSPRFANGHAVPRRPSGTGNAMPVSKTPPHIRAEFAALDADRLDSRIRQCASSDMALDEKADLLSDLVAVLAAKDPARAVRTTIDAIPSGPDFWKLVKGAEVRAPFVQWMLTDPAGALEWFQQNRATKFDTPGDPYHHELAVLRNPLVNVLIQQNSMDAFESFLKTVPEKELGFLATSLPGPNECAAPDEIPGLDPVALLPSYIPIIRNYLPGGNRPYAYKRLGYALVSRCRSEGLADVRQFFSAASTEAAEAQSIATEAAGCMLGMGASFEKEAPSEDTLKDLEQWVRSEFPDTAPEIMEQARQKALQTETEHAAWIISHLKSSNSVTGWPDETIAADLTSYSMKTRLAEALELAATIRDPWLRESVTQHLERQQPARE